MIEAKTNRITIDDFDGEVVEQLVRYIQTGEIDDSLSTSPRELLLIADKYDVGGLKLLAQSKLIEEICIENVCATLDLALLIADTDNLCADCCNFIVENRKAVQNRVDWQTLSDSAKVRVLNVVF